jgi:hypothetical protein
MQFYNKISKRFRKKRQCKELSWPQEDGWDILPDDSPGFAKSILELYGARISYCEDFVDSSGNIIPDRKMPTYGIVHEGYICFLRSKDEWSLEAAEVAGATFLYLWNKRVDVGLASRFCRYAGDCHQLWMDSQRDRNLEILDTIDPSYGE